MENMKIITIVDLMREWGCDTVEEFVALEEALETIAELEASLEMLNRLKDIANNFYKEENHEE